LPTASSAALMKRKMRLQIISVGPCENECTMPQGLEDTQLSTISYASERLEEGCVFLERDWISRP